MRILSLAISILFVASLAWAGEKKAPKTYTKVGDKTPVTQVTTIDGKKLNFSGKVVVMSLFATWCPPCRQEMPELEKLWQKHSKNKDLILCAVGREETKKELAPFKKRFKLSFPLAGDPKREVFSKFAKSSIPRLYVLDRQGKIIYQSIGFDHKEFDKMISLLEKELQKKVKK